jgi:hypothetical protein
MEYLDEKSMKGTGTKAQLNKERIKQITGDKIKKIIWALSASTICFNSSFLLSSTVCTTL